MLIQIKWALIKVLSEPALHALILVCAFWRNGPKKTRQQ